MESSGAQHALAILIHISRHCVFDLHKVGIQHGCLLKGASADPSLPQTDSNVIKEWPNNFRRNIKTRTQIHEHCNAFDGNKSNMELLKGLVRDTFGMGHSWKAFGDFMVSNSFGRTEGVRDVVLNAFWTPFWHSENLVCRAMLGLADVTNHQHQMSDMFLASQKTHKQEPLQSVFGPLQ